MLVKYLHTNRPAILLLLPVLLAALWFPFYYYQVPMQNKLVSPYVFLVKKDLLLDGLQGTLAAATACIFCALLLNRILINSELTGKPSFIYAFAYVMAETFLRTDSGFYTWQISQFIMILALGPLLRIYNQRHVIDLSFETGLLSGIAFLVCPPCLPFFLIIYFFLQRFRPFSWREWLFPLVGFVLVLLFYFAWCFLKEEKIVRLFVFEKFDFQVFFDTQALVLMPFAIVLLISITSYLKAALRAIIHARKQRLVILYLFVLLGVSISLLNLNQVTHISYFFVCFPAALFMGHYLGHGRARWLAELLFLGCLVLLIIRYSV